MQSVAELVPSTVCVVGVWVGISLHEALVPIWEIGGFGMFFDRFPIHAFLDQFVCCLCGC